MGCLTFMIVKWVLVSKSNMFCMLWNVISLRMGMKTLVWILGKRALLFDCERLGLAPSLEFSHVPFSSVIPSLTYSNPLNLWHLLLLSSWFSCLYLTSFWSICYPAARIIFLKTTYLMILLFWVKIFESSLTSHTHTHTHAYIYSLKGPFPSLTVPSPSFNWP